MCIMMVESRRAPSQAYWNVAQFINSEYARRHGYRFVSVNSADSEIAGIKSGQTGWADRQAGLNRMLAARHWLPSCGSPLYVDPTPSLRTPRCRWRRSSTGTAAPRATAPS